MIINRLNKSILLGVLFLYSLPNLTIAQDLDNYIREGIKNNIVLQQKSISLKQALYSLKIAQSYYLPSSNLQGNYTTGEGGRFIPLPIGDLLNPVYSTLNQMTNSKAFPIIENEEIGFFPHDFYDVKLHTTFPIVNTDIYYNQKIQRLQVKLKEYELNLYKRELIRNIKTAYFNFLSASLEVKIYGRAIDILTENVRITQVLLQNGKGLAAYYLRSQSEKEKVIIQFNNAQNDENNGKKYFNFLLNRNLISNIDTVFAIEDFKLEKLINSLSLTNDSLREELLMLETGEKISHLSVKMNQSYITPKISCFLDLGMQNQNWKFNDKSRYYLAGFQLDFPIFNGGKNSYKIKQSVLEYKNAQLNYENNKQQFQLSNEIVKNNLFSAWHTYQVSLHQLKSAQSYFNLIDKGYKEGVYSQIEFLDARNQLTSAELMLGINKYKVMIEIANVERETADVDLNSLNE